MMFALYEQAALPAYAGSGPWSHLRLTYTALDRFSEETGWQVNLFCTEIIAQGAVVSDTEDNQEIYQLHCDNNDLVGCSYKLDQLKQKANKEVVLAKSLMQMGQALHLVQDFYAHSNWTEIFQFSMVQAPIEQFTIVAPPMQIQTGYFPDIFPDVDAQVNCFLTPPEQWNNYIYGATHACLNKDSNQTQRGIALVPNGFGLTYHELSAQYAINHSVELLKYYAKHNPMFMGCFHHLGSLKGCNQAVYRHLH
ncbi:MAG: hypothetical protein KDK39_02010 [Leptospiraceae bacterium]|nr:hypothetical protein [Leptospiraceae bacterium]